MDDKIVENLLSNIITNTIFFTKNLDDFDKFYIPGVTYPIIAYRSSLSIRQKYTLAQVFIDKNTKGNKSSKNFYHFELFNSWNPTISYNNYKYFLPYQSYSWCDDLNKSSLKSLCIPYYLYVLFSNKFYQKELLLEKAKSIKNNYYSTIYCNYYKKHLKNLSPRYMISTQCDYDLLTKYYGGEFVISASYSEGGMLVFLIKNQKDMINCFSRIKSPVIRVEHYMKNTKSVTQTAFVLSNNIIIKYPPSVMILKATSEDNKNFIYCGNDFKHMKEIKSLQLVKQLNQFTHTIGELLRLFNYKGVYNVDYLCDDQNNIYFLEINPRFGSSNFLISYATIDNNKMILNPFILQSLSFIENEISNYFIENTLSQPESNYPIFTDSNYVSFLNIASSNNSKDFDIHEELYTLYNHSIIKDFQKKTNTSIY